MHFPLFNTDSYTFQNSKITSAVNDPLKSFLDSEKFTFFLTIDSFIQFNVPFKIISLISRRANQYMWVERNRSTPASRTWLVPQKIDFTQNIFFKKIRSFLHLLNVQFHGMSTHERKMIKHVCFF